MCFRCISNDDAVRKDKIDEILGNIEDIDDYDKDLLREINQYVYELKADGWVWLLIGRLVFFIGTLLGVLVPVLAGLQGQVPSGKGENALRVVTVIFSVVSLICNTISVTFKWTEQGHTMLECGFRVWELLHVFCAQLGSTQSRAELDVAVKKFHAKASRMIRKAKTTTIDFLAGEQEDNRDGQRADNQVGARRRYQRGGQGGGPDQEVGV